MSKYGHRPHNWFEAIVNRLGGENGAEAFLRGDLVITEHQSWREADGVIYFSVTSDGTTGEQWVSRLEDKGFYLDEYVKEMLCSPDFKPTNGVATEVAVLKGMLFATNHRSIENVLSNSKRRKLIRPNTEIACLILEKFSKKQVKQMGLSCLLVMHEPIHTSDPDGHTKILSPDWGLDFHGLDAINTKEDGYCVWVRRMGFAFAKSQTDSKMN